MKNKIGAFTKRLGKTRKRGEGAVGEKGKKKSRILLIVCGLLLLAGAIIGIVMFRMQAGASAYNESIKTAEKYADSGEYELAVLTYENAIKDRPKDVCSSDLQKFCFSEATCIRILQRSSIC